MPRPHLERFSFVLRTSWAWAGWTILHAPKERQFIAWGRQPQDPETRKKKPFTAPAGRQARAVAELSCRPDWGSERGSARVAWGHPGAYASRLCTDAATRLGKTPMICNP